MKAEQYKPENNMDHTRAERLKSGVMIFRLAAKTLLYQLDHFIDYADNSESAEHLNNEIRNDIKVIRTKLNTFTNHIKTLKTNNNE